MNSFITSGSGYLVHVSGSLISGMLVPGNESQLTHCWLHSYDWCLKLDKIDYESKHVDLTFAY